MKKINTILLLVLMFFPLFKANAFSLYYNENYEDNEFKIEVSVNKESSLPKAIEGLINFNSDSFELIDIVENNSAIEKWIIAPYLNENNQISFSGIFNSNIDDDILLFNLIFKKINTGELNLVIDSGIILAEQDTLYDLELIKKPSIFNVKSPTHPNAETWYSNKNVKLVWDIPSDAKTVKILIDEKEDSYPTIEYSDPVIKEKEIDLDDGIWYFHIRYFGDDGWSPVEHRKIMIDTEKPNFSDVTVKKDSIEFFAEDDLSGVELYELIIPSSNQKYYTDKTNFKLPKSGKYNIILRGYDKAENYLEKEIVVTVKETPSPYFSKIVLDENKVFVLGNIDNLDSKIYVSIVGKDLNIVDEINVHSDGSFIYTIQDLNPGLYNFYLTAIADNGFSKKNEIILVIEDDASRNFIANFAITYVLLILGLILIYNFSKKDKKNKKKKKIKNKKYEL